MARAVEGVGVQERGRREAEGREVATHAAPRRAARRRAERHVGGAGRGTEVGRRHCPRRKPPFGGHARPYKRAAQKPIHYYGARWRRVSSTGAARTEE
jgi:hypothetical protein